MSCFLRRQELFGKAPQDIGWLKNTSMSLNSHLLWFGVFFPRIFVFSLSKLWNRFFPPRTDDYLETRRHLGGFRTQKPHTHLQQSKQRLKLSWSASQHPLSLTVLTIPRNAYNPAVTLHSLYYVESLHYLQIKENVMILFHTGTNTDGESSTFCGKW